jgi:hypothetical protein
MEAAGQTLSGNQLVELVDLIEGADSVEFKLTVPEGHELAAVRALGMDPLDGQIRQVFFFDTPGLDLLKSGVIVRARRTQHKGDDAVVKLRPVVPDEVPPQLRASPDFGVEVDAMPGGYVCSGTMKHEPADGVHEVAAGERPLHELLSKDQRHLFAAHAPAGLDVDELAVMGPMFVIKLKLTPEELRRNLVAELWLYPDDSAVLELSTKCGPREAFEVAVELRAFLIKRGVTDTGEHHFKATTALQFFASRLQ